MSFLQRFKAIFALVTGGFTGIIKYWLDVFNTQILAKIPNKEAGTKYLKDAQAVYACLRAFMENHSEDLSEKRKQSLATILSAIDELTKALEDFNVDEEELDMIVAKVKEAIDSYKKNR